MEIHNTDEPLYYAVFESYEPTRIIFESGAFTQVSEELLLDRSARGFVVLGGESARRSGVYADLDSVLLAFDFECELFRGVPPEPTFDDVRNIVRKIDLFSPDVLIAIGGGSVLDAAKAAWISWQTGLDVSELVGSNRISECFPDKEFKRIIAVPTTSGTGSEVTPYANIVDSATNVKRLISDRRIVPSMAMIDPAYAQSMSPELTATTALDAMTHAIESLLNTKAIGPDSKTDSWAVAAVSLIRKNLPIAVKEPRSNEAREALSAAATLAGMCISVRPTSLPHLISFSLTGLLPHGRAVAIMLPVFWRYFLQNEEVRMQTRKLASVFGVPDAAPEEIVDSAADFIAQWTGVRRLSDLPFLTREKIDQIAEDAVQNPMKLESCPRPIPASDAKNIIKDILEKAL